jgi:hypothetical protein
MKHLLKTFSEVAVELKEVIINKKFLSEKVFFLHLHKCGGTSLDRALRDVSSPIRFINSRVFHLQAYNSRTAFKISNLKRAEFDEALLLYNMSFENKRYISGHFCFSENAYEAYSQEWNWITLLRNPVDRFLSAFFYRMYKDNYAKDYVRPEMSLEHFIENAVHDKSYYAKRLSGIYDMRTSIKPNHVDTAIKNLEKFKVIGVLEERDHMISRLEKAFNITLKLEHKNQASKLGKQKREEMVTEELVKKIEKLCEYDIIIYEAAKELSRNI